MENEEKWPENGTLEYNTILQLMLFCKREGKWNEMAYVDLFFTLRNHPEWQRQCELVSASSVVMTLKRQKPDKNLEKVAQLMILVNGVLNVSLKKMMLNYWLNIGYFVGRD